MLLHVQLAVLHFKFNAIRDVYILLCVINIISNMMTTTMMMMHLKIQIY